MDVDLWKWLQDKIDEAYRLKALAESDAAKWFHDGQADALQSVVNKVNELRSSKTKQREQNEP